MYSRSFITLQLNHCRRMNYFNAVVLLSKQGQKALGFHKKNTNCVLKMNEGLTGLKQHEGE